MHPGVPMEPLLERCAANCDMMKATCKGIFVYRLACEDYPTCIALGDLDSTGGFSTCPATAAVCASYSKDDSKTARPETPTTIVPAQSVGCETGSLQSSGCGYNLLYQGAANPDLPEGTFSSAFSVPSAFNQAFPAVTGMGDVSTANEACSNECNKNDDCVGYRLSYEADSKPLVGAPTASSAYKCVGVTVITNMPSYEHVYSYNRACLAVATCGGKPDASSCAARRVFCTINKQTQLDCPATCKTCTATTTEAATTTTVADAGNDDDAEGPEETTKADATPDATAAPCGGFKCTDSGTCVNKNYVCNGLPDCDDGSDETSAAGCITTTPAPTLDPSCAAGGELFVCGDGKCKPIVYQCNSIRDCSDGSDEDGCTTTTTTTTKQCSETERRCATGGQCIHFRDFCDGVEHCSDGSDEKDCTTTATTKTETSECIRSSLRCDGHPDCDDYTDELFCTTSTKTATTTTKTTATTTTVTTTRDCKQGLEFECANGECVRNILRCDGHPDCGDYSDEYQCTTSTSTTTTQFACTGGKIRCGSSNQCIWKSYLCNQVQDCDDNSDEIGCAYTNAPTQAPTKPPCQKGSGDVGEDLPADSYGGYAEEEASDSADGGRRRRAEPNEDVAVWGAAVKSAVEGTGLVTSPITVTIEQPTTSPHEVTASVFGLTVAEKVSLLEAVANSTISVDINGEKNTAYAWSFYQTTAAPTTQRSFGVPDREEPVIRIGVIAGCIAGGTVFTILLLWFAQCKGRNQGSFDVNEHLND
eukprot:gene14518-33975_t